MKAIIEVFFNMFEELSLAKKNMLRGSFKSTATAAKINKITHLIPYHVH